MDCRWLSARTLDVPKFQSCARGKRLKPCSAHLSPATGLARHLLLLVVVVVVPQHQVAGCPAGLAGAPRARLQHHHVLACAEPRCSPLYHLTQLIHLKATVSRRGTVAYVYSCTHVSLQRILLRVRISAMRTRLHQVVRNRQPRYARSDDADVGRQVLLELWVLRVLHTTQDGVSPCALQQDALAHWSALGTLARTELDAVTNKETAQNPGINKIAAGKRRCVLTIDRRMLPRPTCCS